MAAVVVEVVAIVVVVVVEAAAALVLAVVPQGREAWDMLEFLTYSGNAILEPKDGVGPFRDMPEMGDTFSGYLRNGRSRVGVPQGSNISQNRAYPETRLISQGHHIRIYLERDLAR